MAMAPSPEARSDAAGLGSCVVAVLVLRWAAGIAEPHTIARLSESVALAATAWLGILSLRRMRLAAPSILLVTGLAAWVFVAFLSAAANAAENTDAAALVALLVLYALFADTAAVGMANAQALRRLARFLAVFIVVGAGLAIMQVATGTGFVDPGKPELVRAFGSDVHPVSFAIQIVLAMVGCEVVRLKSGRPVNAVHVLVMAIGLGALYLTFARTAWLMAVVICAATLAGRSGPAGKSVVIAGACVSLVLLPLTGRFGDLASLPLFLDHFSPADNAFDFRYVDNSLSWRIVNWNFGLHQALERPLLGFGPGQSANASAFSREMHNIFLEAFFEGGLFGLVAFLVVLGGIYRLHRVLPDTGPADRHVRKLLGVTGLTLLGAVSLSTSLVDQLMTVLIYLAVLGAAGQRAARQPPAPARIASMLAA